MIAGWKASLAGADLADWVTVAAYLGTAALSAGAARQAFLRRRPRERLFWLLVTGLLCFLGVNELLDLQTLLTDIGRANARAYGWYGNHRQVQYYFVLILSLIAVAAGMLMLRLTRRTPGSIRLALAGLVFIGLFVLLRAASFHHLDDLLGSGFKSFPLGSFQEVFGIALVALAAALYRRRRSPGPYRRAARR
ncbi:hypothetical protein EYB45_10570 [Erythrobacteraceae bacterium CFH 75059]|uniref:hypothetical protein n=1 Tax=Qipengyuania thermophila TaxID=2509361 RepID=UPI0010205F6B|nr:hypothetical protein [Qipengyuania thermophila]TCD01869.1 hypothetical protein EYB45_10570 [Erythrobacteraceae bacterium CFH 75059]